MDRDEAAIVEQLEADLRSLMREAAEARFQLEEAARQRAAAERDWLLRLLEVSDAFERVFRNVEARPEKITDQMKVWLGNFRAVGRLLTRQLTERGVERMPNATGRAFDPTRQTVLETLADPARQDGTIVEEVQGGWERGGEILRKAAVKVVRNDGGEGAWEE